MKKIFRGLLLSLLTAAGTAFWICALWVGICCLFMTGCSSIKIPDDLKPPIIKPDTKPEPPPQPPPVVKDERDAINPRDIHWVGDNYAGAKITAELKSAWMSPNELVLSNPAPSGWPLKFVKVDCQGIVCLFYHRNNTIFGGKFDWLKPGQTRKSLENVKEGYNGHDMPPGTKCYTCFVDVDGKQRSNIVEVTLK